MLIVGVLAPIFGIFNDYFGVRINIFFGMIGLAVLTVFMARFELFSNITKFFFLLLTHIFMNQQSISLQFGCARLFGVKCGL